MSYNQKLGTKAGVQDSFVIYEQFRSKPLKTHVTGLSLLTLK